MDEIVPDIFTWGWFSETHGYNFNGHLVRRPEGNLCIIHYPWRCVTLPKSRGWAP